MSISSPDRRAVITGMGVVASNAPDGVRGLEPWWKATLAGESGIRRLARFDPSSFSLQYAGEVEGFAPEDSVDAHLLTQTDSWSQMALAAARWALDDAGLDPSQKDANRLSVILGGSAGGNEFSQREMQNLWSKGPIFVGAYAAIASFFAAAAGQVSIVYGMKGPSSVVASEGASALDALARARRAVRHGTDLVVTGGTEAALTPFALACQLRSGNLSDEPSAQAYRPFDERASGYLPGEGGAILLVEELEHARHRDGAHIYAEIAGYAATHDAYHHNRPAPDGRQLTRALAGALEDAGLTPDAVDAIFADGVGTPEGDAAEARAIASVFGERTSQLPVTVPKSMTGRLSAGGAALDVAAASLSLRDACLPPTINLERPVHAYGLDLVRAEPRQMPLQTVLVIARGLGGFNSALVLRRVEV